MILLDDINAQVPVENLTQEVRYARPVEFEMKIGQTGAVFHVDEWVLKHLLVSQRS